MNEGRRAIKIQPVQLYVSIGPYQSATDEAWLRRERSGYDEPRADRDKFYLAHELILGET